MLHLVFGDLHINKPFPDIQVNPYLNTDKTVEDFYAEGLIDYVQDIMNVYTVPKAHIIFIGDITHYNQDKFERVTRLLDSILDRRPDWFIDILIGNHDTSNSYRLEIAKIHKLSGYRNRVLIRGSVILEQHNNLDLLYLPYLHEREILPSIKSNLSDRPLVILSHNNIYTTRIYGDKEMITFSDIKSLSSNIVLINGHIHRYSIEPNYYQIGAAAPTSFKEYYQAVGCCVFDDVTRTFNVHKNTKLFFISVNNQYYIDNAKQLLDQCVNHHTKVFLRTNFKELISDYRETVVAVEVDDENQQQKR